MRILIISMVFIPSFCFSQKDSTKFIDNFYLEINGGIGEFSNIESYQSPSGTYLVQNNNISINLSTNLLYRNKRWLCGFTGQTLYFVDDMFSSISLFSGLNILKIEENKNVFFGPKISYGYIIRPFNNTTLSRFSLGMTFYFKKLHAGIAYDWIKPRYNSFTFNKTRNLYFEIGYSFNLDSFRKKK